MVQSNAILLHLANRHRTHGCESAASLAQAREWLLWEANRIGPSLPSLRHCLRFADAPAPAEEFIAKSWLPGAGPSIADNAGFAYICFEDIKLDLAGSPRLRDWMKRMLELPRWRHPCDLLAKPA
jgi:glutathione S-transferase